MGEMTHRQVADELKDLMVRAREGDEGARTIRSGRSLTRYPRWPARSSPRRGYALAG
jgi:hypothetical protein